MSRRTRSAIAVVVAAVAVIGTAAVSPAAANAAGTTFTSTVTLTSSNYDPAGNASYVLTAAVSLSGLKVGLGVTPTGTVTFTDDDFSGDTQTLGTAKIKPCFLTVCKATLNAYGADLSSGFNDITATYSGDRLTRGSDDDVIVDGPSTLTPDGAEATSLCFYGEPCHSGYIASDDGSTAFYVDQPAEPEDRFLVTGYTSDDLECENPNPAARGDVATWDFFPADEDRAGVRAAVVAAADVKTVTYITFDAAAHPGICFQSDSDFPGATPDDETEEYYAVLGACTAATTAATPCIQSDTAVTPPPGHTAEQKTVVRLAADDPKMTRP